MLRAGTGLSVTGAEGIPIPEVVQHSGYSYGICAGSLGISHDIVGSWYREVSLSKVISHGAKWLRDHLHMY